MAFTFTQRNIDLIRAKLTSIYVSVFPLLYKHLNILIVILKIIAYTISRSGGWCDWNKPTASFFIYNIFII